MTGLRNIAELNWSPVAVALLFSGEETFGRYLDLYTHHNAYNNLKGLPRHISYAQYLDLLASVQEDGVVHKELSSTIKAAKDYEKYAQTGPMRTTR